MLAPLRRRVAVRSSRRHISTHHSFYIDGKWVAPIKGVRPLDVINPATEMPCASIALGSAADVDMAVDAARTAFDGSWGLSSRNERLALLERLAELYKARQDEMAGAISLEMGARRFCSPSFRNLSLTFR